VARIILHSLCTVQNAPQNSNICAVFCFFRLTALQKKDLYDLMVTDRKIADRQNYGNKIISCVIRTFWITAYFVFYWYVGYYTVYIS